MLSLRLALQHLRGTKKLLARYIGPEEATQVVTYLGTERTLAFLKPRVDFLVQTQPPQALAHQLRDAVTEVSPNRAAGAVACILLCGLPPLARCCHTACGAGCCCWKLSLALICISGQWMQ